MGKKDHIKIPSSILIATFSLWKEGKRTAQNGILDPMMYYFKDKVGKLLVVDQPYPGSDRTTPILESYAQGKLKKRALIESTNLLYPFLKLSNKPGTHLSFKLRDLISVLSVGMRQKDKIELFIGLESVNAIGGIILKKLGKVDKVVYYVSDYSPARFNPKILNDFYLWTDRFCASNCDYIWDVSKAMQPARIKAGLNPSLSSPVVHVPNALYKNQLSFLPVSKRQPNTIVFVGTLGLENGPDVAIDALRLVVKKIPKAQLHIYGGGGKGFELEYLKQLAKKHGLEKHVIFHSFISNQKELSDNIKKYMVAVAPYKNIRGSIRLYGDATKLRLYVAGGLPIISTSVPPLGKELQEAGAAIIVRDNAEKLADEIIKLLTNKKTYIKMSESASKFANKNMWENTYDNALRAMGY